MDARQQQHKNPVEKKKKQFPQLTHEASFHPCHTEKMKKNRKQTEKKVPALFDFALNV